jgi:hypothetical protein
MLRWLGKIGEEVSSADLIVFERTKIMMISWGILCWKFESMTYEKELGVSNFFKTGNRKRHQTVQRSVLG